MAADDRIRIDDASGTYIPGWHRATMSAISTRRRSTPTAGMDIDGLIDLIVILKSS